MYLCVLSEKIDVNDNMLQLGSSKIPIDDVFPVVPVDFDVNLVASLLSEGLGIVGQDDTISEAIVHDECDSIDKVSTSHQSDTFFLLLHGSKIFILVPDRDILQEQELAISTDIRARGIMCLKHGKYIRDPAIVWKAGEDTTVILIVPRLGESTRDENQVIRRAPQMLVDSADFNPFTAMEHSDKTFWNGLLVCEVDNEALEYRVPSLLQLQFFVDAGFDLDLWRRLVSLVTLKLGNRILVLEGECAGLIGYFSGLRGRFAQITELDRDVMETTYDVPLNFLQRHFEEGDLVCTIPVRPEELQRRCIATKYKVIQEGTGKLASICSSVNVKDVSNSETVIAHICLEFTDI